MGTERKVKLMIVVELETSKDIDYIIQCTRRGLYRGYDTEPHYVAEPKKVNIVDITEIKE